MADAERPGGPQECSDFTTGHHALFWAAAGASELFSNERDAAISWILRRTSRLSRMKRSKSALRSTRSRQ